MLHTNIPFRPRWSVFRIGYTICDALFSMRLWDTLYSADTLRKYKNDSKYRKNPTRRLRIIVFNR